MIDLAGARKLLDFAAKMGAGQRAEEQLQGAVAMHNILEREGVAYLADEVGMGKTYVALGAIALFRFLDPSFRILVIAPRQNIQEKWGKELRNFVQNNYRIADMRVKGLDGRPVRRIVMCDNLLDLVHQTALDPDRDFFARMTSFSIGLRSEDEEGRQKMRHELRSHLPWLENEALDLRSKSAFKDHVASAICCALPTFDLVVVDEAHNLKHGFSPSVAARNRVMALAFGRSREMAKPALFPKFGPRARRVLFLSATPVEDDYAQLWNQLDVFGRGKGFEVLKDRDAAEDEKKAVAARILVRRVTTVEAGGKILTKNLYRRTWRQGGIASHDDPIRVESPVERLTVALVQKKVSELLGHERFQGAFQAGMLASFESFLQTAKVLRKDGEEGTFDDAEQTKQADERLGIDVNDVNRISADYRSRFGTEMPHPKMDALVDRLSSAWTTGEKALVFVRRVASVKELKRKLDERYDEWLIARLRAELPARVTSRFDALVAEFRDLKQRALDRNIDGQLMIEGDEQGEEGGIDSFFAWFFRGEGPADTLSGATLQRRFTDGRSSYATFFEDNLVAWALDCAPDEVISRLAEALGLQTDALVEEIRLGVTRFLTKGSRLTRAEQFEAVQAAALDRLQSCKGEVQRRAKAAWLLRPRPAVLARPGGPRVNVRKWLELPTFFTELRKRPSLRNVLWPEAKANEPAVALREQEVRRLLLSAAARLGHPLIELHVLIINRLGSLALRARDSADDEEDSAEKARIGDYLDLLERQMREAPSSRKWCAFEELSEIARHFELIMDVNLSALRDREATELPSELGRLLGRQSPVGGMAGQVNRRMVGQFRMPGYPFILISTDLLQEGEDLHTFCSAVHHYGISWTPSAMEQRIGRIDRVRSETDRRLAGLDRTPAGQEKLQVYLPHLQDTVEVLQVRKILDRMERFLRLMHESLITKGLDDSKVDTGQEFIAAYRSTLDEEPLKSAFPIRPEDQRGRTIDTRSALATTQSLADRVQAFRHLPLDGLPIQWEEVDSPGVLHGTARIGERVQPFTLYIELYLGLPRLRCVSPVGNVNPSERRDDIVRLAAQLDARVGAIPQVSGTYDLTVEQDVLLTEDQAHDAARLRGLLERVLDEADDLERLLLEIDQPMRHFRMDLEKEAIRDR